MANKIIKNEVFELDNLEKVGSVIVPKEVLHTEIITIRNLSKKDESMVCAVRRLYCAGFIRPSRLEQLMDEAKRLDSKQGR